jgi:hypothetical protein
VSKIINCIECGKSFPPKDFRSKFCSDKCRYRFNKRKKRLQRKEEGRCPQCGGVMDYPVRIKGETVEKQKISYCSKCRERWKEIYSRKRIT